MAVVAPAVPQEVACRKLDTKAVFEPIITNTIGLEGGHEIDECKSPQVRSTNVMCMSSVTPQPEALPGLGNNSLETSHDAGIEEVDDGNEADRAKPSEPDPNVLVELPSEQVDNEDPDGAPDGASAPAAGAPADAPPDAPNAPVPAADGVLAAAYGVNGTVPPTGHGSGPVFANGDDGGNQGGRGGAGGGGAADWADENHEDVDNFMARAYQLFLQANPPVPEVCSAQEAAAIAAATIGTGGEVTMASTTFRADASTARAALAPAATGDSIATAGPSTIAVSEAPAPVEQMINLVNEPAPAATGAEAAAAAAAAAVSSSGKASAAKKSPQTQTIASAIKNTGASTSTGNTVTSTGGSTGGKKAQQAAASASATRSGISDEKRLILAEIAAEEARWKAAQQHADELLAEEAAEKAKKERAKRKNEKKKAAKAAKKAVAAAAAGEEGEEENVTANSSAAGSLAKAQPPSSVGKVQPAATDRELAVQELGATALSPAGPEQPSPKLPPALLAPEPVPPPVVSREPAAPMTKKDKKEKSKEVASATAAGASVGPGASSTAVPTAAAALASATAPVLLKAALPPAKPVAPLFALPQHAAPAVLPAAAVAIASAAAPVAPVTMLATAPAAVPASSPATLAKPKPPAMPMPFINPALALVNPVLAAAAGRVAGVLPAPAPGSVRPVVAAGPHRTFPGVPIHAAPVSTLAGTPVVYPAGAGPVPIIYRPGLPVGMPARVVPVQPGSPQPVPVVRGALAAPPIVHAGGIASNPLVSAVPSTLGAQFTAPVARGGARPANAMMAAYMQYRSTAATAAAVAVPAVPAVAAPAAVAQPAVFKYDEDEHLCVVCMENSRSIVLLPCGHLVLCETCLPPIVERGNLCPICREGIRATECVRLLGTDCGNE
ncbi:hypothetical protein VaNZ11_003025 [Volvox africanus]|uniref:RING-type domain-containing protein n=1 Tax=Volvox africanus TaxID=51714 RepID=A0ABQ5RTM6_9CHLO|nr:hypothetical protein VaNZ11_003025 [Volvox africanus]